MTLSAAAEALGGLDPLARWIASQGVRLTDDERAELASWLEPERVAELRQAWEPHRVRPDPEDGPERREP